LLLVQQFAHVGCEDKHFSWLKEARRVLAPPSGCRCVMLLEN
jgi:hypothetical protein